MRSVAVIGASLAGLRAAEALRAAGFDGRLTIVGAERHRPYDRPPLSKHFLLGTATVDDLALTDAAEDVALAADWRLGVRAESLDPAAGTIALSDGAELAPDGIVIATGGRPRTLPGHHAVTLRTIDDAIALRDRIAAGVHTAVVIGAGFLGAELASTLRSLGVDVTVVEALDVPLAGALGAEMGALCGQLHADHGVRLITGHGVTAIGPHGVILDDDRVLPADLVIAAVGMVPNTEWLNGTGLATPQGVPADAGWRTRLPNVVAVGDVAFHHCVGRHVRHEHWTNAAEEPAHAVANLLAGNVGTAGAPVARCAARGYFWSDQYGVRIQFAGSIAPTDECRVVEGSTADRSFLASYHRDGEITGVLAMNQPRAFNRARRTLPARNRPPDATTTSDTTTRPNTTLDTAPDTATDTTRDPDPARTTEEDRCPTCSSAAPGGTRPVAVDSTSSTPSTPA